MIGHQINERLGIYMIHVHSRPIVHLQWVAYSISKEDLCVKEVKDERTSKVEKQHV